MKIKKKYSRFQRLNSIQQLFQVKEFLVFKSKKNVLITEIKYYEKMIKMLCNEHPY